MDIYDWPYRIKSARRKKRLVKKDFDKQLIRLDKLRHSLTDQIRSLPPIILEKPYQRGWKRLFVLRDDIKRSDKAEFYQTLLNKINKVQYHYDRSFKKRKIRKGVYHYYDAEKQKLRELSYDEFHGRRFNLSEAEKQCFYRKEIWNNQYRKWEAIYSCTEAWRFVLTIQPHIVFAVNRVDELLEQAISEVDKHINWNNWQPRIFKLHGNAYKYWGDVYFDKPQYINKLKNKPRYTSKEAYLEY